MRFVAVMLCSLLAAPAASAAPATRLAGQTPGVAGRPTPRSPWKTPPSLPQRGGGADIGPLAREGVPVMGLNVDGTATCWYHHTDADTIDKLDAREMSLCVAAMAVMACVVADLPEPLPHATR